MDIMEFKDQQVATEAQHKSRIGTAFKLGVVALGAVSAWQRKDQISSFIGQLPHGEMILHLAKIARSSVINPVTDIFRSAVDEYRTVFQGPDYSEADEEPIDSTPFAPQPVKSEVVVPLHNDVTFDTEGTTGVFKGPNRQSLQTASEATQSATTGDIISIDCFEEAMGQRMLGAIVEDTLQYAGSTTEQPISAAVTHLFSNLHGETYAATAVAGRGIVMLIRDGEEINSLLEPLNAKYGSDKPVSTSSAVLRPGDRIINTFTNVVNSLPVEQRVKRLLDLAANGGSKIGAVSVVEIGGEVTRDQA